MNIKYTLIIILLGFTYVFAQLTQEQKQKAIDSLDSRNALENARARGLVEQYKIIEAIPKIESKILNNRCVSTQYLNILQSLGSPNIINLAHRLIDSSNNCYDPVETRYECTQILFEHNDYSTAQFVFEYYNAKASKFMFNISLIPKILEHRPDLAQQSKDVLLDYTSNFRGDPFGRYIGNAILTDKFPQEAVPILVNSFRSEPGEATRISSLMLLFLVRYDSLQSLMRERIINEPATSYRLIIVDSLLNNFPTPENLYFVQNALLMEPDPITKSLIESKIEYFIPLPDSTLPPQSMIDSLISNLNSSYGYGWVKDSAFYSKLAATIVLAQEQLQNRNSLKCALFIKQFQNYINITYEDSLNNDGPFISLSGWKFLYNNAQYILDKLPSISEHEKFNVKLTNSSGSLLPDGTLQYYEGSWKDAINNSDGTFQVNTNLPRVSLRMTYEYGSQTLSNVSLDSVVTFQTVNTLVSLKNSSGAAMDTGRVQYYAGAWRDFGVTSNGTASKELLPGNYSFRMTYAYGSNDKQQNTSVNPNVIFQTVNAAVELRNSTGDLIDAGKVQYYSGAWRDFGTTSNGSVNKELLSNNYSFRMIHEYVSNDKQQNIGVNKTVTFTTVPCKVNVKSSTGQPIDNVSVKYYSGAWRQIGQTSNGSVTKELLPANLTFRINYGTVQQDKTQNLITNPNVEFILP